MKNNQEIRERLKEAANEILARSQSVQESLAMLDPAGNLSFGEQGTEREFDDVLDSLGDRSRRELLQVLGAFDRLDRGTYGLCAECGAKIDEERMQVVPFTEHCFDCAAEVEKAG
jgi:DnaK suppressor protein